MCSSPSFASRATPFHCSKQTEAWAEVVPPNLGTGQDLRAADGNELRTLEQQWRRTMPGPQVATGSTGPQPAAAAHQTAAAVDTDSRTQASTCPGTHQP